MNLKKYLGKNVEILDIENEKFKGFVTDYIFADDNEPVEEEAIIIETSEGKSIEFRISEISRIEDL